MKKIIALSLAALMLTMTLAACGTKGTPLKSLEKSGKLVVASSPDFPPFESLAEGGQVVGIEMDILKQICAGLGVELEIQQIDFDSVLPGVQSGKFALGASGISVTEKRQKNVLFTDAYCLAAQAIVVPEGSPITCKADLTGKAVSVQTGTTAEEFCMANGYAVSAFTANSDAQAAVLQGKVDAWVIDDLTAAEMVKAYNAQGGNQLSILSDPMTTEPYAFAMAFGSEDTIAKINGILDAMQKSGAIADIFAAYDAPFTPPEA